MATLNEPTVRLLPGSFGVFWDGHGSGWEGKDDKCVRWPMATCGLIRRTVRVLLSGFVMDRGQGPYLTCAATGYRASQEFMVTVGGRWYIRYFAPTPRPGGERSGIDG